MKNLFGCLVALLIFPLILVVAVLFHGWYLQVIYDIGIVPILGQFGLMLPQLGYWVFVLIHVVLSGLKVYFNGTETKAKTDTIEKIKITNAEDAATALSKVASPVVSNILTKLGQLLIIYIAFTICF